MDSTNSLEPAWPGLIRTDAARLDWSSLGCGSSLNVVQHCGPRVEYYLLSGVSRKNLGLQDKWGWGLQPSQLLST
jgi:hypothetical protein